MKNFQLDTFKYTFVFGAIQRSQSMIKPVMIRVHADDERTARKALVKDYVLLLASRIVNTQPRQIH